MGKEKNTEAKQPKNIDLIPEERLKEILNILLPYGYSYHNGGYTGVSPYIGDRTNIITIYANEPECWDYVFVIIMDCFDEESDESHSLGFYKGIMKVIAPELHSSDEEFKDNLNVLDFNWAPDEVQDNRFPVKAVYEPNAKSTK